MPPAQGSSIFFLTYAAAQVPSNMVLVRVGGPLWLGVIVTFWGVVATAFAGVQWPGAGYCNGLGFTILPRGVVAMAFAGA